MKVLSDRPIEKPEADEFGRSSFAKAIANALVLPTGGPSIVVAIEGEWGSGKTSVLNMVTHNLESHSEKPQVIRLDSWLLAGSEAIVQTFLTQFAAALGREDRSETAKTAADKVLRFSRLLSPARLIPVVEPYASMVQKTVEAVAEGAKAYAELSKLDVQKMKTEVAEALRKTDKAIVIILDDLDRLDPEETRQVFRLVKAVADFERVAYLLAYDPVPVHQALSFGGAYDGAAYLEKIVQVGYPLPVPSYLAIKDYLSSRLQDLLSSQRLEDFEKERLEKLLSSKGGLAHATRNPRDVNRLVNRLSISMPATRGEVNAADIIAFEALSVRYPDVALAIRKRPYEFVGGWLRHAEPLEVDYSAEVGKGSWTGKEKGKEIRSQRILKDRSPEDLRILTALLNFLFPGFIEIRLPFDSDDGQPESHLRVSQPQTLLKLLAVGPVSGAFLVREVERFFSEPAVRSSFLADLFVPDDSTGWLKFATSFLRRITVNDPSDMIACLTRKANELAKADRATAYRSIQDMEFFAYHLLKALPQEETENLFKQVAANEEPLSFSCEIVFQVARELGLREQERRKPVARCKSASRAAGAARAAPAADLRSPSAPRRS